jgi:phage N-6-adenine-methyltransferase
MRLVEPRITPPADFPRDDFETPRALFSVYHQLHRFTVDAAANHRNALVPKYYDREQNGLLMPWKGERVWCHPPHSETGDWVRKARYAATLDGALSVLLVPAETNADWFHEHALPVAAIRFLRGAPGFRLHGLPVTDRSARPAPAMAFCVLIFRP